MTDGFVAVSLAIRRCRSSGLGPFLLALLVLLAGTAGADTPAFELKDGDRVLRIGSEFTEQASKDCFLEAALTARWSSRRLTFRNLGWAGDQPSGIARGYFGGAEEGYRRLLEEVTRLRPTVIFLEYGANAAYAGPAGLDPFIRQMKQLIGDLRPLTDRIILVSPPAAEKLPDPLPEPTQINHNRGAVTARLRALAEEEGLQFVDLFNPLRQLMAVPGQTPLTTDTIRYNTAGYAAAADVFLKSLGLEGVRSEDIQAELRDLIRAKNNLYFHQYRPQNETYLRGFRKHEQGQNAREIAEFEPLIAAAEARIAAFVEGKAVPEGVNVPSFSGRSEFEALAPDEQVSRFKLADGLEIIPFAAEPLIANPIHMNFDGRGRLWVASSPIYPQIRPGAIPEDEIIILEDTDGDGRADSRTVFADGLLIPTAVLPDEQGGAYVANSTELLHLADRDGDGRADQRTVVLSGFGTEDTHHILHTLRWTPDALLSFNQSIYIHSQIETPYGVQQMQGSGIWRFRPETARASTVAFGMVNPWGYIFDAWGQGFATDGAGGEGINYIFPGAAYVSAVGYPRVLTGMNPGQPKFCGLELITGGHFGPEFQQTLVTADFRGNRVCQFRLSEEGSGYVSRQQADLLTCSDRAFRPVDLKLGPDGALFIADWHNPIINHGEVDFRDPRRDHTHGRIWRITQQGRALAPRPVFEGRTVAELVQLLTHEQIWTRQMARVHLRERSHKEVAAEVGRWLAGLKKEDPLFERNRLEALWTFQAIGQISARLMQETLGSSDHHVRAAAIRVLSQSSQEAFGLPDGVDEVTVLEGAVQDPHPQVRLEAVNALRQLHSSEVMLLALKVLDQPLDRWLDYALWLTARQLEPWWGPGVAAASPQYFEKPKHLLFLLQASDSPTTLPALMELLTSHAVPRQDVPGVLKLISKFARPDEARVLFDLGVERLEERGAVLTALVEMKEKRQVIPGGDLTGLQQLFPDPQALHLAGLWGLSQFQDRLMELAGNREAPQPQRIGAIRGLAALKARQVLIALAQEKGDSVAVRIAASEGVFRSDPVQGASLAIDLLSETGGEDEPQLSPFLDALLSTNDGPARLEAALEGKRLPEPGLALLLRKAGSLGPRGGRLMELVSRMSGRSMTPAVRSPSEIAELLAQVKTHGNPVHGESLFRSQDLACLTCHSIGGAGGEAGPDLISLGASSPVDYILDSLLNPSAKIKEGYHTSTFAMDDGSIQSGIVVREGGNEVILRGARNQLITLPKDEIEERATSTASLMPGDLVTRLNHHQLLDLLVFLSSLGKEGDYKVPQNRYVRRWVTTDQKELFSRVRGGLNPGDWSGLSLGFDVQVTTPGPVALRIAHPEELALTLGGRKLDIADGIARMELPAGRHRLELSIPPERSFPILIEVVDVDGTMGHAEPANRP